MNVKTKYIIVLLVFLPCVSWCGRKVSAYIDCFDCDAGDTYWCGATPDVAKLCDCAGGETDGIHYSVIVVSPGIVGPGHDDFTDMRRIPVVCRTAFPCDHMKLPKFRCHPIWRFCEGGYVNESCQNPISLSEVVDKRLCITACFDN